MNEYVRWVQRQYPASPLLVDTNVLLLLVIGSLDPALVARFKRTETYSTADFRITQAMIASFNRVTTVQPVLTEVSNLLGQLHEPVRRDSLNALKTWIDTFSEPYLSSQEIASMVEFSRFGLTDTSLIYFASEGSLILTDDFPLSGYIGYLGFPVLNLSHVRGDDFFA